MSFTQPELRQHLTLLNHECPCEPLVSIPVSVQLGHNIGIVFVGTGSVDHQLRILDVANQCQPVCVSTACFKTMRCDSRDADVADSALFSVDYGSCWGVLLVTRITYSTAHTTTYCTLCHVAPGQLGELDYIMQRHGADGADGADTFMYVFGASYARANGVTFNVRQMELQRFQAAYPSATVVLQPITGKQKFGMVVRFRANMVFAYLFDNRLSDLWVDQPGITTADFRGSTRISERYFEVQNHNGEIVTIPYVYRGANVLCHDTGMLILEPGGFVDKKRNSHCTFVLDMLILAFQMFQYRQWLATNFNLWRTNTFCTDIDAHVPAMLGAGVYHRSWADIYPASDIIDVFQSYTYPEDGSANANSIGGMLRFAVERRSILNMIRVETFHVIRIQRAIRRFFLNAR